MKRREFLVGVSVGVLVFTPVRVLSSSRDHISLKSTSLKVNPKQWLSVEALLEHLLPSEPRAPGARDVNALAHFRFALEDPMLESPFRVFLERGIKKLDRLAYDETGNYFFALSWDAREKVLRTLEKTPQGQRWLKEVLELTIEALLADPVYSRNPNGVGWKWLNHTPGFPTPPKDKRYFLL